MSAGLGSHGAAFQLRIQVRQEVGGNHLDLAGQALGFDTRDGTQQGVSAAARNDQGVDVGIRVDDGFGSGTAGIGRGAAVLGLQQFDLIVGMSSVPLFNAGLVAFPASLERSVTGFPAFQADLAAALVGQDGHQLLAVVELGFMHGANIVLGSLRRSILIRISRRIDDAEELRNIHFVVIAGLDNGTHLRRRGVADNHTVAVGHRQGLGGSRHLLGDVSLVNPLNFNIQRFGSRVDQTLDFAAQGIGGTPDGDADLNLVVRMRRDHQAAEQRQSQNESKDLFHESFPPYY